MSIDKSVHTDTDTDKVNFILGLYDDNEFTENQRKYIYDMRFDLIDAVVKYYNQVIEFNKSDPDPQRIVTAKTNIKNQLLEVIRKQEEMYNKMDEILHLVWDQLKECLNYHISEDLRLKREKMNTTARRNSSFFRTDWTNCCPDDLKEIARKLAIHINKKQIIVNIDDLTHNIRIACSVVISYYLIHQEWDEIILTPLDFNGPPGWKIPREWNSSKKKYFGIIPFTVMCWINKQFGFDDTYKQRMVGMINQFIVGIATQSSYDGIDLSKYHKMIVSSGEFVHNDSDRQHDISLAVRSAMLNDQQMAAQSLANEERQLRGGKRNRNTRTRTRVSSQRNITKYKRAKTGKHKRINFSKYKRINSSKYKRTV